MRRLIEPAPTSVRPTPQPRGSWDDQPVVPPPANVTVMHDHVGVLYTPDGQALVRRAGFTKQE